jgi:hypothetical protein
MQENNWRCRFREVVEIIGKERCDETPPLLLLMLPRFKTSYMTLLKNCREGNITGCANKETLLLL